MTDALIGTWRLRSHRIADAATGAVIEPFGTNPGGVLMFGPDGHMAALITGDPAGDTATAPLLAYAGRFRLLPPDRFVTTVEIASFAQWVGSEQVRAYRIEGDRMELTTAPAPMPGEATPQVATLTWIRAAGAVAPGGGTAT